MKTGGRAAVEKQVSELRKEILADAGKMTKFGTKAGYLPPPPGMAKKKEAEARLAAKKAAVKKVLAKRRAQEANQAI
jgi:hypothetical protein